MKEIKHAKGTFENPWIFCEDRMIKLESVGSWLNYDKGIVFPMLKDGDIDMSLDVSTWNTGLYTIKFQDKNTGKVFTEKVIIE